MQLPSESDTKKLKHAIVEVIADKGKADKIECGILRGIGPYAGEDFLWTVTDKKVSRTYNLDYYNILSVMTYDGVTRTYTFFMADEDEQKAAREIATKAFEALKHLALPEGNEKLLDVSKLEDIPNDFSKLTRSVAKNSAPSATGAPSGYNSQQRKAWEDYYGSSCGHKGQPAGFDTTNKEPEPHNWKRKSRKPTKKMLEKMREKIAAIAKREYEFEPRPIKGEKQEKKIATSSANSAAADDHQMFAGYDDGHFPFG